MASSVFAPAVHGVSLAGPTTVTRLRRPPAMRVDKGDGIVELIQTAQKCATLLHVALIRRV